MATGERRDPWRSYNFRIEIDGIDRGGFRECSGLEVTQDVIEYREGTDKNLAARKLPGLTKHATLTLKRGMINDPALFDWHHAVTSGEPQRRNGSIILLNDAGEEQARWSFVEAWPSKWIGPSLNASGNEVAIESLEIVHEGILRR